MSPQNPTSSASNAGQVLPGGGTVAAPTQAVAQPVRLLAVQVPACPAALQAWISLNACCVLSLVNTAAAGTQLGESPPDGLHARAGKNLPQSSAGTGGGARVTGCSQT